MQSFSAGPWAAAAVTLAVALGAGGCRKSLKFVGEGNPRAAPARLASAEAFPAHAVSKGSFTAWTEPARPRERENYIIVVSVKLPAIPANYERADLTGSVTGSDGYTQHILHNGPEDLRMGPNEARLEIKVPGAAKLVRDIIRIRSALLNESQELELVFQ